MLTLKDIREARRMMKKFKGQPTSILQFPDGKIVSFNKRTHKITELPNAPSLFNSK